MSVWWLVLIVPCAGSLGGLAVALFVGSAYDRGYMRGWSRAMGWKDDQS